MGFFARLLLGTGELKPELKDALNAEGLVLLEEGLTGSIRYEHFRAPGKRFHKKVTGQVMGIAVSQKRFVVYSRSGRTKLVDTPFTNPKADALEVTAEDGRVSFRIDYDRVGEPKVSGGIRIVARTPNAETIAREVNARLGR